MRDKLFAILKVMSSFLEIAPQEAPPVGPTDPAERIRRSWERRGQVIQHALDTYPNEQRSGQQECLNRLRSYGSP